MYDYKNLLYTMIWSIFNKFVMQLHKSLPDSEQSKHMANKDV